MPPAIAVGTLSRIHPKIPSGVFLEMPSGVSQRFPLDFLPGVPSEIPPLISRGIP